MRSRLSAGRRWRFGSSRGPLQREQRCGNFENEKCDDAHLDCPTRAIHRLSDGSYQRTERCRDMQGRGGPWSALTTTHAVLSRTELALTTSYGKASFRYCKQPGLPEPWSTVDLGSYGVNEGGQGGRPPDPQTLLANTAMPRETESKPILSTRWRSKAAKVVCAGEANRHSIPRPLVDLPVVLLRKRSCAVQQSGRQISLCAASAAIKCILNRAGVSAQPMPRR